MYRTFIFLTIHMIFNFHALFLPHALAQAPSSHHHSFGGAENWANIFDDPKRDQWQKPHEVIQALGLAKNSVIADIGSGTGYFSAKLAHFVPTGHVYGVDTEPDMVKYLTDRITRDGLNNVTSITGTSDDPQLPTSVDLILMVDVFHHIDNRERYLKKLRDYLKVEGRIALIDFNKQSTIGPPLAQRITEIDLKAEMLQAGYTFVSAPSFLPNQYFLIFKRSNP